MKRRVMQTVSLCLLAGVLTVGTQSVNVLAEEEITAEADGEVGESLVGELIFAQCDDFINIRSSADTEGEVTAKIFNNGSATVVSVESDGWLGIQSGNAAGYVKADYFATGAEAEAIANEVAYVVAVVQTDELVIRSEASADSVALDCVNTGDELEVVEDDGDWLKVARENDLYGYVNADYVVCKTYYPVAKTLAELEEEDEEIEIEEEPDEEDEDDSEEDYDETDYDEDADITIYDETSYYEDSYSEPSYYEETYTETAASTVTYETEAYVETQTEAPATEAATEASTSSSGSSSEVGVVTDSSYNGDDYYYDANEDAYYYGSTMISSYSYTADAEDDEEEAEEAYYEEAAEEYDEAEETVQAEEDEAASTSSSVSGEDIATYATQYIGNDYVWGGTSLTDGADCSGFVQSVYAEYGISVARVAADQAEGGTTVDADDVQAGDLLFYSSDGDSIDHVAIYIGDDTIVHAANSERGIVTDYAYYDDPVTAVRYY